MQKLSHEKLRYWLEKLYFNDYTKDWGCFDSNDGKHCNLYQCSISRPQNPHHNIHQRHLNPMFEHREVALCYLPESRSLKCKQMLRYTAGEEVLPISLFKDVYDADNVPRYQRAIAETFKYIEHWQQAASNIHPQLKNFTRCRSYENVWYTHTQGIAFPVVERLRQMDVAGLALSTKHCFVLQGMVGLPVSYTHLTLPTILLV